MPPARPDGGGGTPWDLKAAAPAGVPAAGRAAAPALAAPGAGAELERARLRAMKRLRHNLARAVRQAGAAAPPVLALERWQARGKLQVRAGEATATRAWVDVLSAPRRRAVA